jgi:hypothetical protein
MAAGYWSNRLGPRSSIEEAVLYGLTLGRIPPKHEDHCRIEQVDNKSLGHLSSLGRSSPGGENLGEWPSGMQFAFR